MIGWVCECANGVVQVLFRCCVRTGRQLTVLCVLRFRARSASYDLVEGIMDHLDGVDEATQFFLKEMLDGKTDRETVWNLVMYGLSLTVAKMQEEEVEKVSPLRFLFLLLLL